MNATRPLLPFLACLLICCTALAQQTPAFTCGFDALRTPAHESRIQSFEEQLRLYLSQKNETDIAQKGFSGLPYVVPVVVHIIHNGGAENIPDAQVLAAIDHLNDGFAAQGYFAQQGATVDTRIRFCLARRDPDGNATTGITRTQSPLTDMIKETQDIATKNLSRWNPNDYVNIWVVKEITGLSGGPGVAGYAYFPGSHGQPEDGMVCEARFFGISPDQDAVLIHEMGHYFGLYHTFEGGCPNGDCTVNGDRVCDTPPDQATHTVCNYNSCSTDVAPGSPFASDVDDYTGDFMDYSPFSCYRFYTPGQAARMQAAVETARVSLLSSKGCQDPCTQPIVAAFSAAPNPVAAGQTVLFTNISTGATAYSWSESGTAFSQNQNASRVFNSIGIFPVLLTATNSDPNCTVSAEAYIQVQCPLDVYFTSAVPDALIGQTVLFTNATTGTGPLTFEWSVNGQPVSAAQDLSFLFQTEGIYSISLQANGPACSKEYAVIFTVNKPCGQMQSVATAYAAPDATFFSRDLAALSDGTLIHCGIHSSRPAVTRWDAAGNVIWHKVTTDTGGYYDMEVLPNEQFLLSGMSGNKMLLAKMDASGNYLWYKKVNLPGYLPGNSGVDVCAANPDGSFGLYVRTGITSHLLKINAFGAVIWAKRLHNVYAIGDLRIATDGTGDFLLSLGDLSGPALGISVFRISQAGQFIKGLHYAFPGNGFSAMSDVDLNVHEDGGYSLFFTGYNSNSAAFGHKRLVRCAADGSVMWAKRFQSSGGLYSAHTIFRPVPDEGGWLVSDIKANATLVPQGNYLLHVSGEGVPLWQRKYGGGSTIFEEVIVAAELRNGQIKAVREAVGRNELRLLKLPDSDFPLACLPDQPVTDTTLPITVTTSNVPLTLTNAVIPMNDAPVVFANDVLTPTPLCAAVLPCTEICDNQSDDDDDGYVDCFDPDCGCFDTDTACVANPVTGPFSAQIAWTSTQNIVKPYSTPFVGNLNPQVDSIPEIIVMGSGFDEIFIYRGDGSNKSSPVSFKPAGLKSLETVPPVLADINADGIPELLLSTWSGVISVYTNYQENQSPPFTLWFDSSPAVSGELSALGAADFDHDGIPEVFAGRQVFAFDFTDPAVPTLSQKLIGTGHAGAVGVLNPGYFDISAAADILSRSDCNGDPDCDGLELAAGAHIYSIDLDPNDGDGYQIKVQRNLNALNPGMSFSDGPTQVADINLDGKPDVVVNGRSQNQNVVYVWDKNGLVTRFVAPGYLIEGKVTICNAFDDKKAGFAQDFPEIIWKWRDPQQITACNLQAQSLDPAQPYWWVAPSDDVSHHCFISAFDFDGDGFEELVSKGDTFIRVYYGGAAPFPPGVNPGSRIWFQIASRSGTVSDGPVVADVDGDREAEIVYAWNPGNPSLKNGRLQILESAGLPWSRARPVWNQYNYFGVNINDDLSVPKIQQKHWLEMGGIGSGKRPYNTHLAQVASLKPYDSRVKVPDATLVLESAACKSDSLELSLNICNLGSAALPAGTPIAFYLGDPTAGAAPLLFPPVLLSDAWDKGVCRDIKITIPATYNQTVFAVVNDNGTLPAPFNPAADFPVTGQPECHYENNFVSFSVPHQTQPLDLGLDRPLCKNSVTELSAGPGFQQYRWQDGSTGPTFTVYTPGKYWVDAYDACGFRQTDTVNITLNVLAALDLPDLLSICEGEPVYLAASGFSAYAWSPADSVSCADCASVDLVAKQSITMHLTASQGDCFVSDSVRINVNPLPVVGLSVINGDCETPGVITPIVSGTMPLGFLWSDSSADSILTPAQSGTYILEITDGNGCTATGSATVSVLNSLNVFLETGGPGCVNTLTGSVNLTVTDGQDPFQFFWSNNATTEDISDVGPGIYTVSVTDANGCTAVVSDTLTDPPAIVLILQKTEPACAGEASGALDLTAGGGTGNLQLSWSNNSGAEDLNAIPAGIYTVSATDMYGCTATVSDTLHDPPLLILTLQKTDPDCAGAATGSLDLLPAGGTGGLSFSWSNNEISEDLTLLPAGAYTVLASDAKGCTATASEILSDPPAIQASMAVIDPKCAGETTGALDLTVSGGTGNLLFSWSGNSGAEDLASIPAGIYTVLITDAKGCTATLSGTLTDPPVMVLSLQTVDPGCAGEASGALDLTASGGTGTLAFFWSNNETSEDLISTNSGTYTVLATDANGCSATVSGVLNDPPAIVSAIQASDPECAGEATGTLDLTASGGAGNLQFSWSDNSDAEDLTLIPAGTYTVTISDAGGCTAVLNGTLTEPPALVLTLQKTDPKCAGEATGALDLTASGGTGNLLYSWSNNANAEDLTLLPAGIYSLVTTDANGCTTGISETLTDPPAVVTNLSGADLNCPGDTGLIDLTAGGGTPPLAYSWSTGEITENINVSQSGTYTVTVTDANGCIVTDTVMLATLGTAPVLSLTTDTLTCVKTSGVVSVTSDLPNTAFLWSGAGGFSSTASAPAVSGGGVFTVMATEPTGGCTSAGDVFVPMDTTAPAILLAADYWEIPCGQHSVELSAAGSSDGPDFSIQWTAGAGGTLGNGAQTLFPTAGSGGFYDILITDLSNGCTASDAVEVVQLSAPMGEATADSVHCFGETNGVIRVVSTSGGEPPFLYSIDNQFFTPGSIFKDLPAGIYPVFIRDANGCVFSTETEVFQPAPLAIALTGDSLVVAGAAAQLQAIVSPPGFIPAQIAWQANGVDLIANQLEQSVPLLQNTVFRVEIMDENGCSASDTQLVKVGKGHDAYGANVIFPGSPNGTNGVFLIFAGPDVLEIESLAIFDRWGNQVFGNGHFQPNDASEGWNGTFRGKAVSAGVFVWAAKMVYKDGTTEVLSGDVTVLR